MIHFLNFWVDDTDYKGLIYIFFIKKHTLDLEIFSK